jgi:hypothetical protein
MSDEDIERYKRKSGDSKIGGKFAVEDSLHGFATFDLRSDCIVLHCIYGDGRYWVEYFMKMAKDRGLPFLRAATRRNPKAIQRRLGFRVVGYVMEKEVE